MPPNNITAVHCVEQEIKVKPKGLKIILMGDLNVRPRDPRDEREEDLMMTFVDRGLVSMTDNFMPDNSTGDQEAGNVTFRGKSIR